MCSVFCKITNMFTNEKNKSRFASTIKLITLLWAPTFDDLFALLLVLSSFPISVNIKKIICMCLYNLSQLLILPKEV